MAYEKGNGNALGYLDRSFSPPQFVTFLTDAVTGSRFEATRAPRGALFVSNLTTADIYRVDPTLRSDTLELSVASGGSVILDVEVASKANSQYVVLVGVSAASPGTALFGHVVPLNFDFLTDLALGETLSGKSTIFSGFIGKLDMQGRAKATFNLPAGIAPAGVTIHFCALVGGTFVPTNATWVHLKQ